MIMVSYRDATGVKMLPTWVALLALSAYNDRAGVCVCLRKES
jgi:hypothetical protein